MILRAENNIATYLRMYRMSVINEIKILMQNSNNTHGSHSFKIKYYITEIDIVTDKISFSFVCFC